MLVDYLESITEFKRVHVHQKDLYNYVKNSAGKEVEVEIEDETGDSGADSREVDEKEGQEVKMEMNVSRSTPFSLKALGLDGSVSDSSLSDE